MALTCFPFRQSRVVTTRFSRCLVAGLVMAAVVWAGMIQAANQSVQGAKKEDGGFDGDAPTAILIEGTSGSVLFEKNADELRAPSSMMKLMTAEVVFHAIKQGDIKLTDEYRISENAWRRGGAPAGGSTMFAALNSKVSVDGARTRPDEIDLHQFQRAARPRQQDDGAGTFRPRALYHADLSGILQIVR